MYARHNMRARGYLVLYDAVPDEITDHLRSLCRDNQNFWVNEESDSNKLDAHRLVSLIPDSTARALRTDLQRFYMTFFPEAEAIEWAFLKTTVGASDQLVRREFKPVSSSAERADPPSVPWLIYVATDDKTVFYLYGWNTRVPMLSKRKEIVLNKGDLFMFRGDTMYSRVSYPANHMCVHGYLDTPYYPRRTHHSPQYAAVKNDTRDADTHFCYVWKGTYVTSGGEKALCRHLNEYHGMYFKARRTQGDVS